MFFLSGPMQVLAVGIGMRVVAFIALFNGPHRFKTRIVHNGVFVSPETDGSIITASVELEQISGAKYIDADNSSDIVAVSFERPTQNSRCNEYYSVPHSKSGTTIVTLCYSHIQR